MPFGGANHSSWPNFPCLLSQALALCCRALHSISYISKVWLNPLQIPQIICLRRARLNLQNFAYFVPSIIRNLTGAAYSSKGFCKLSRPGIITAAPRWDSRHFDRTVNLTCYGYMWYARMTKICSDQEGIEKDRRRKEEQEEESEQKMIEDTLWWSWSWQRKDAKKEYKS